MRAILISSALLLAWSSPAAARETIRLASNPALSPDGKLLAFDWNGDIWLVGVDNGEARPLTLHSGRDSQPAFSADGSQVAFISDREGGAQVFVVPVAGGIPRQVSFHTAGYALQEWTPDGRLLVKATRDFFWRHGERFFLLNPKERSGDKLLFDDYGTDAALSPDGKKLLFTREGEPWWRKGYKGSRVTQIWQYDLDAKSFTKVLHLAYSCRWPMWKPDQTGFYYVGEHATGSELMEYDFAGKKSYPLTKFGLDAVAFPCVARNGSAIVFRHLFDFYRFNPATKELKKLDLYHTTDRAFARQERRMLNKATGVAFSQDGLEIAFIAGGDLWVMDTELREPQQITRGGEDEREPVFAADGQAVYFISDAKGKPAIWRATRGDSKKYWWQNRSFNLTCLTDFDEAPSQLTLSPDGTKLAYVRGRGDLWVAELTKDGLGAPKKVFVGWNTPDFDWSPDGKWLVYAVSDNDFNRDVWILPLDASKPAYNLSRHPFNEGRPAWSPDGKTIAFAGSRASGEGAANLCLVRLRPEDDERTARDRKLEKALDKMKGRDSKSKGPTKPEVGPVSAEVVIDFDDLHERVKRISLKENGAARDLFWSPDSKKLAFIGSYDGSNGTFTVDVDGDALTPKSLTTTSGTNPVWLKQGNQIVWLVAGVPTSTSATAGAAAAPPPTTTPPKIPGKKGGFGSLPPKADEGAPATGGYTFSVRQEIDVPARHAAVFDTAWRIMRDNWYDERLNNADWNAVRAKYRDAAAQCPDMDSLTTVIQLMLGELNGSHLGFSAGGILLGGGPTPPGAPGPVPGTAATRDVTGHLGVRFDLAHAGPGLKVRDVLPGGPAGKKRSLLLPGDVITRIEGVEVKAEMDLTTVLNGAPGREVTLTVQGKEGKERTVTLTPIPYALLGSLLYEQWLDANRKKVHEASGGKLGYLHISAMSMPSFRKFEEELYSQGAGKDGLIIDVRENGGGSTADHLLTALTQPVHAITVARGGGPGYPQDRKVYATWNKPIVVLCNQNSYSNAEIFSHAVKTLGRGKLIGTPTAGGVVSTGAMPVMDAGLIRLPSRGWFLVGDGEDMEKNGAVPHHLLWPEPGQMPQGHDAQLARALEVLQGDVAAWHARPLPKLRKSTER